MSDCIFAWEWKWACAFSIWIWIVSRFSCHTKMKRAALYFHLNKWSDAPPAPQFSTIANEMSLWLHDLFDYFRPWEYWMSVVKPWPRTGGGTQVNGDFMSRKWRDLSVNRTRWEHNRTTTTEPKQRVAEHESATEVKRDLSSCSTFQGYESSSPGGFKLRTRLETTFLSRPLDYHCSPRTR